LDAIIGNLNIDYLGFRQMNVFIASDHAGFSLKNDLVNYLTQSGNVCFDLGTDTPDSVDYPDYAHLLCDTLNMAEEAGENAMGVLICGTGIGMSIAANRHSNIRCAVAVTPEMATLARQHNNANVIALGGRLINADLAHKIMDAFLNTAFEGGRHEARLKKIDLPLAFFGS
jgi:ribose 5-phosphate isomerase B